MTRIISHEFGLLGFRMTLAIERAASFEELQSVAANVIARVKAESGEQRANEVASELEGVAIDVAV